MLKRKSQKKFKTVIMATGVLPSLRPPACEPQSRVPGFAFDDVALVFTSLPDLEQDTLRGRRLLTCGVSGPQTELRLLLPISLLSVTARCTRV